jgi:short subunit dehydrogenase-like uncharacterized protein
LFHISRSRILRAEIVDVDGEAGLTPARECRVKIVVYGASGYTGRLIASELVRRDIDMVLSGRNIERLRDVAGNIGERGIESRPASSDDPAMLAEAFRGCQAVINCAGPFTRSGSNVVRAAIAAGCHYVDIAGEQLYVNRIFDTFAEAAERAKVAIVPAMNDDGLPADLIAHLTATRIEPVEELLIGLNLVSGGASRGTMRSGLETIEILRSGGLTYERGEWRFGSGRSDRMMTFPGDSEATSVAQFPLTSVATVPRHARAQRVEGVIKAEVLAALTAISPELINSMADGPPEAQRRAGRFTLVADAIGSNGRSARGVVQGVDLYGTTAVIAVEGARRLITNGGRTGVLAPAQAYDATGFLDFLRPYGLSWSVNVRDDRQPQGH